MAINISDEEIISIKKAFTNEILQMCKENKTAATTAEFAASDGRIAIDFFVSAIERLKSEDFVGFSREIKNAANYAERAIEVAYDV